MSGAIKMEWAIKLPEKAKNEAAIIEPANCQLRQMATIPKTKPSIDK